MARSIGNLIWLCWVLSLLFAVVEGNFGGPGGGGPPGNGFGRGGGRGGPGRGFRGGKFGGKGFRPGQNGGPGGNAQDGSPDAADPSQQAPDVTTSVEITSPSPAAPPAVASTSVDVDSGDALAPPIVPIVLSSAPAITTSAVFVPPSSIAYAVGEADTPLVAAPAVTLTSTSPPIPPTVIPSPIPSSAPLIANAASIFQPSITTVLTISMTVTVPASDPNTATPLPDVASDSPSPVPTSGSPSLDLAPLSTNPGSTMSASAKAGMGIGVTFGVLSLASAAGLGLYLWRRRRNSQRLRSSSPAGNDGGASGGLGGFFNLEKWRSKDSKKSDAEWSIESASQVEIVRGANPRTVSRGRDSSASSPQPDNEQNADSATRFPPANFEMIPRKAAPGPRSDAPPLRLPNPALTSNPPSSFPLTAPSNPQPATSFPDGLPAFPSPPSSRGSVHQQAEKKTNSWPLED